jgi:hypothetical protein
MASIFTTAGVTSSTGAAAVSYGSPYWYVRAVGGASATTGTILAASPADDWIEGPVRVDFTLTPSFSEKTVTLEGGVELNQGYSSRKYELTIKVGQKDAGALYGFQLAGLGQILQFLMQTVQDQSSGLGGKRQYMHCVAKMVIPNGVGATSDTEYKFNVLEAEDDITTNMATGGPAGGAFTAFGTTAGTITQVAGQFYVIADIS